MNYNKNTGYGIAESIRLNLALPVMGRLLVVCPSTDANYDRLTQIFNNDPEGNVRLFTTLEAAYAAATTNANDVIALSGNSAHAVTNMIAWSKSRIHVIGMDGGDRLTAQGARVTMSYAAATTVAGDLAVMKVTGTRNTFRNIKFTSDNTQAESLYCVIMAGEGTLYKNCSFHKLSDLDQATAADVVTGEDTGTFINCEFGTDNLTQSADRPTLLFNSTIAGTRAKGNMFQNCYFKHQNSSATKVCIKVADGNSCLYGNVFESCTFIASKVNGAGIASTVAVESAAALTDGQLLFGYPRIYNIADLSVAGGSFNTGVYMVAPTGVATAEEAKAPTVS